MTPRKRWMLQPMSWRRGGLAALVVLILVAGIALMLDADAGAEFGAIVEEPVLGHATPGLALRVLHGGYTLGDVAQGYVFLNDR